MKTKDKQLIKDSALVVADQIASSIPALNIAWGLSKALYGAGIKLRQQRALEWVEMVRDHPEVFTKQLLGQDEFQDGFVFALERYLIERNEEKRQIFRNIFLGFAQADDKETFPLEKFTHTLSQLSELDIAVMKDIDLNEQGRNYQIYGDNPKRIENIFNLINLGILLETTGNRLGHNSEKSPPFVKVSFFGKEFVQYIKQETNP